MKTPLVTILCALVLLSGCSSAEQEAFDSAQTVNSVSRWQEFLVQYPESEHAAFAQNRIIELERADREDWDRATALATVAGYMHYMKAHPDSTHTQEAQSTVVAMLSQQALDAVGGDSNRILRGEAFPIDQFTFADLLRALGTYRAQQMHAEYANLEKEERQTTDITWYVMVPPKGQCESSKIAGVTLELRPAAEHSLTVTGSTARTWARGQIQPDTKTERRISGFGLAILDMQGQKSVYVFGGTSKR